MIRTTPIPGKKANQTKPKAEPRKSKKMGRPTKFTPKMKEHIILLTRHGLIDTEIAAIVGISYVSLYDWKKNNPDFSKAIKKGKQEADSPMEASAWQRGMGYSHPEEKIFCNALGDVTRVETIKRYPPDPASFIFWLCNRHPDKWKRNEENKPEGEGPNLEAWMKGGYKTACDIDVFTDS